MSVISPQVVLPDRVPSWAAVGADVSTAVTAEQAITEAGLDWDVDKVPLYVEQPDPAFENVGLTYNEKVEVPDHFGIQRTDTHAVLGVVGNRYVPVQNRQAFSFLDDLVDSGEAKYVNAGSLKKGRLVYVQAKLPEGITVAGEPIDEYLTLATSHDGGSALQVLFSPVRIWCLNTLNAAIKGAKQKVTVRHSGVPEIKLNEAREILGIGFSYFEAIKTAGEAAALTKVTDAEFDEFLKTLVPDPKDPEANKTRAENKRADIRRVYKGSEDLNNIRGTAWGAYNAVVEYEDHYASVKTKDRDEACARLERTVFNPNLKAKAAGLLLPA